MAEAVLSPMASSILKKLGSLAMSEIGRLWSLRDDIEELKDTVQTISSVLLDAEKQYQVRGEVRVWLDALKDVVYDVDDLLDDISTEALRRQLASGNVVTKEVKLFFSRSNRIACSLKVAHKIKDVRARLEAIKNNRMFHLNLNDVEPTVVDLDRDTHSCLPNVIIGREGDKKEILGRLLANSEEDVVVLPIIGLGGLGKTTLAQMVYNDRTVEANFDLKVWVCVSDVFDIKLIIGKMIGCIDGGKPTENLEMESLQIQLRKRIEMKKYLIVLDDVWNEERDKWVRFCDMIIGGATGSRIIVTTRSKVVGDITCTSLPYELKSLSEMESWDLFRIAAFKWGKAPNEVFEELGKEIARKCGGLPLAIRTIGSLLYDKTKESEWLHFKDEEFSKFDPKVKILETLKLSYNHLPSILKHCFAYCCLFPKGYTLDVNSLTSHWKAHGFVDLKNEDTFSGLNCMKYLIRRCLLQIENEREDGEIVSCKMHDLMHDLAVLVAGEEVRMLNHENASGTTVTRRTRHIYCEIKGQHLTPLLNGKKSRTLIVQPKTNRGTNIVERYSDYYAVHDRDNNVTEEEWFSIVAELKYLRVLVIPSCEFKKLPSFINKFKHLRQLDLSWNVIIEILPDHVTRLSNL